MKNIYLYILSLSIFLPLTDVKSQVTSESEIKSEQMQIEKDGDYIVIGMRINLKNINLNSQEMIILTPIAMSEDKIIKHTFSPVIITGSKRSKALNRALGFGTYEFVNPPQLIVSSNSAQYIPLSLKLPYDQWAHSGILMFEEKRVGCACENEYTKNYDITQILPPLFNPEYSLSYITPPVEEIKRRSDTYTAHLNFKVNRYEILRDFGDNMEVLSEVTQIIENVRNDSNLTISEFLITGYASPEGHYLANMTLSEKRAKAFVNYISTVSSIDTSIIKIDWKGEDWDGLRKILEELNIQNKQSVLDIIDDETDLEVREQKMKQALGGETYQMLLRDYYPSLRRNEYIISYIARSFSLDEAKEQIKNKPKLLSLNEMFLLANSYPPNSEEFKHVFEIATRVYPHDPVAKLNSATLLLENNNIDMAIDQLETIDLPQAWNNLGIAYIRKNEYQRAKVYLDKAVKAGLNIAVYNSDQLFKWLDTQQIKE